MSAVRDNGPFHTCYRCGLERITIERYVDGLLRRVCAACTRRYRKRRALKSAIKDAKRPK